MDWLSPNTKTEYRQSGTILIDSPLIYEPWQIIQNYIYFFPQDLKRPLRQYLEIFQVTFVTKKIRSRICKKCNGRINIEFFVVILVGSLLKKVRNI